MFQFIGAVAGRSIIYEGTVNDKSILGSVLGIGLIQLVSSYTKESAIEYYYITFKFVLYWLVLSSFLGMVASLLGSKIDSDPKTRAWLDGPHLNGYMRATREIGSCILSVFFPMNPVYQRIIENGLGWNGFYFSLVSLWIFVCLLELLHDSLKSTTKVKE